MFPVNETPALPSSSISTSGCSAFVMRTDAEPLASNRTLKLSATPILSDVAAPKISIPPELECTLGKVSTPDPRRR